MRAAALLAVAVAAAGPGCDAAGDLVAEGLRLSAVRSFRQLPTAEARAWLEEPGARLVGPESAPNALEAARRGDLAVAVVLAEDHEADLRLAAELVRAGVPRVALVRGGRAAWAEEGTTRLAVGPRER